MGKVCSCLLAFVFVLSVAAISPNVSAAKPGYYTIAQAKSLPSGTEVLVDGVVTYLEPGECYIQDYKRTAGIWVIGNTDVAVSVGKMVSVIGTCGTVLGEPVIGDATTYVYGPWPEMRPLGMSNGSLGGASVTSTWIEDWVRRRYLDGNIWKWRWEWARTSGATNTGLLVKTWGTVRSIYYSVVNGARWIYVDDGSVVSDLGDTGILVYTDADVERGDYVAVTGVSSTELSLDAPVHLPKLIRVLRTRDPSDVHILRRVEEPVYPFSDEFDASSLDSRWLAVAGEGSLSTGVEPGWLAITAQGGASIYGPQLIQPAWGDWDLEMKLREQLGQPAGIAHGSRIVLKVSPFYALTNSPPAGLFDYLAVTSHSSYDCISTKHQVYLGYPVLYSADMPGDTCYLRFRRRAGKVYGNVSFDGVNYLPEDVALSTRPYAFLSLYAISSLNPSCAPSAVPFTACFDYVRFTNVDQTGGQQ